MMSDDSFYVDEMHDDGKMRGYFECRKCPLSENCSLSSWRRVKRFSFISHDVVIQSVSEHLQQSSLHCLSIAEVDKLNLEKCLDIDYHTETFQDREAYRKMIDAHKGKKGLERRPKGKDGDMEGGKSKDGGKDGGRSIAPSRSRASSRSFEPSPERREPYSEAIARAACRSASATGVLDDRRSEIRKNAESDVHPGYFGGKIKDGGKAGGKIKDGGRDGGNGKKRSVPSDFDDDTWPIQTLRHESRTLNSAVTALLASSSSAVALGLASATADFGTLTISGDDVNKFKLMQDSVARAKRSTQNTHRTLQALALQMQHDTEILSAAEKFLQETISRWRRH